MTGWVQVVRMMSWVIIVAGVVVVLLGGWYAVQDLSSRGESLDGLGAFIGLLVATFGAFSASIAGLVLFLCKRHPTAALWTAAIVYGSAVVLAVGTLAASSIGHAS